MRVVWLLFTGPIKHRDLDAQPNIDLLVGGIAGPVIV
jgi:hypothetical protein